MILLQAEVTIDLTPFSGKIRKEWERLRAFDILFLMTYAQRRAL